MKIKTQDYNEVTVIETLGELDSESVEMFKDIITRLIGTNRTGIVIDMRATEFIDSCGLEKLLWARDYCDQNACQLKLVGLDDNCRKILEITRLEKEFDCYCELAEAVKSFA
ncbi:MAG: STAS domain-containing protein [Phycisphaerae bacterium]